MLSGLIILFAFTLTGNIISTALELSLPGSVLGLLALLVYLRLTGGASESLSLMAEKLIGFLPALLIPPGVGLFFLGDIMQGQWLAVGLAMFVGTLLSIAVTAWVMQWLIKREEQSGKGQDS